MDFGEAIMTDMVSCTEQEQDTCHEVFERTLTSSQSVLTSVRRDFPTQIFPTTAAMSWADDVAGAA